MSGVVDIPHGQGHRATLIALTILAVAIPLVAASVTFAATIIAVAKRSNVWPWYLAVMSLAWAVFLIDPTPLGIGEFRTSEGQPY